METSDSSDASTKGGWGEKSSSGSSTLSYSSDEDSLNANSEVDECFTEGKVFESESENKDNDKECQEIRNEISLINEYSEEEKFLFEKTDCNDPVALYKLFFTDYILERIVEETNKYAEQCLDQFSSYSKTDQNAWQSVTKDEMNTFFGILLIIGIVQLPDIKLYWSDSDMYVNGLIKNSMERTRFLSILKYLHFSDNNNAQAEDLLHKIRNIVETIGDNFKSAIKPGKNIVIDKSLVPSKLHGRFYPNVKNKRLEYGIRLYKLHLPGGYTYNIIIYVERKKITVTKNHLHDVVMNLTSGLLYEGRILFTDNYFTSVSLAEELLGKKTFICGKLKMSRIFLPPQEVLKQLRGCIISIENRKGVKYLKCTNEKKPVSMLSTCVNQKCTIIEGKNKKLKPDIVLFYNDAKKSIKLSDKIPSYFSFLKNNVKWYKKIMIELICGTCLVNAWYIHKKWGNKNINFIKFREHIINHLLVNNYCSEEMSIGKQIPSKKDLHFLHVHDGHLANKSKRCETCYKRFSKQKGVSYALQKTPQVLTYCNLCEGQTPICIKCFEELHQNM